MSLFKRYGESLLDQPIGIEESRVRQQKEGETKGIFQNNKRYERVARRAYRQALRKNDMGGAMKALDWIDGKTDGNGLGSGIQQAGVAMGMAGNQAGNFMDQQQGASTQLAPSESFAEAELRKRKEVFGGPEMMGPPSPTNLQSRIGLFGELKNAIANGGDFNSIQRRATKLGISTGGLNAGFERAQAAIKASPDSPSFGSRLASFGSSGASLFDRYTSSFA